MFRHKKAERLSWLPSTKIRGNQFQTGVFLSMRQSCLATRNPAALVELDRVSLSGMSAACGSQLSDPGELQSKSQPRLPTGFNPLQD